MGLGAERKKDLNARLLKKKKKKEERNGRRKGGTKKIKLFREKKRGNRQPE